MYFLFYALALERFLTPRNPIRAGKWHAGHRLLYLCVLVLDDLVENRHSGPLPGVTNTDHVLEAS